MASVTLKNLRKAYGRVVVVKQVDLTIADKEFLVLLGPSGCGKSTVLRMIAGLETITDGDIFIGDRRVNDVEAGDRDIAMVFQNYALYPHMTARKNMAFCLENLRMARADVTARVDEAARILSLEPLLDRLPSQMSGGQRQRVAIGRAIVRKPKVFLMDEPLSNLDAKLRGKMRAEISRLHERIGVTTVYVTHDQVEAMTMAHRIVIIHEGRIQQVGRPMEVYDHPANKFVAGFIGSPTMNFMEVEVTQDPGGGRRLKAEGLDLPLPEALGHRLERFLGATVTLGMRPQHFIPAPADHAPIRGTVVMVEPYGPETYIEISLGEVTLSSRLEPGDTPTRGRAFGLDFAPDKLHFFDPQNGAAVG